MFLNLNPNAMFTDPKTLLAVLTVVWMITTALFGYIIKMKDKGEESTKNSLSEIKSLIGEISLDISKIKSELDNNVYNTRELNKQSGIHTTKIHSIELKQATSGTKITDFERRIAALEKKVKP